MSIQTVPEAITAANVIPLFEPKPEIETFTDQGSRKIGGATVHFTVEQPANPEHIESDTAFVIAHGICGIEDAYVDLRHTLAQNGYRAITYKPPRASGATGYHPKHFTHPEKLLGQAVYGSMMGAREQFGYDKFVIAAHSLGGLSTKSLIDHHGDASSELVESIMLMDTVGLHPHNLQQTGKDFLKMIKTQIPPFIADRLASDGMSKLLHAAAAEVHYLGRDPTRFFREAWKAKNTLHSDMTETLGYARDILGIRIGYLGMTGSVVFSTEKALEHSGDYFDEYRIRDNDHLGPMNDPEGTATDLIDMATIFAAQPKTHLTLTT